MWTKLEHTFSALFCLPTNSEKVNALALLYSMAECNVKFALVVHSSGSLSLWLFSKFTKFYLFSAEKKVEGKSPSNVFFEGEFWCNPCLINLV
jgi:hypothetical protein